MYILSFNTAPAISDLAFGIDVPIVQYGSVDTDKEKTNWEIEDGKMLKVTSNTIPVEINFKLYIDNQQSSYIPVFS